MKAIGKIIKHMVKVNSGIQMEMSLMVNGRMIKHMGMESILTLTGRNMKVNGRTTYNVEGVLKCGLMGPSMRACIKMGRNMEWVNTSGLTTLATKAIGLRIKYVER